MDILKLSSLTILLLLTGCTIFVRGGMPIEIKKDINWDELDSEQKISAMNKFCPIYLLGPGSVNVDESSVNIDNSMVTSDISGAIDTLSYSGMLDSYVNEKNIQKRELSLIENYKKEQDGN